MYLAVWSNAVWELEADGKPTLATIDEVYARAADDRCRSSGSCTACFDDGRRCDHAHRPDDARSDRIDEHARRRRRSSKGFARATQTLTDFYDSLPRVRRALANVPTYMVFDDHDVTDDWNLGRAWRDRVFTSPLGRRIITQRARRLRRASRTGATTRCATAQAPFRRAARRSRREYQPLAARTPATTTRQRGAQTRSQKLFGLNQPDPEEPAPQLKWHFSIDGPRHRVLVLDTRTRRVYRSRYLPPGLLSAEGARRSSSPTRREQPLPAGRRRARRRLADAAGAADDRDAVHRPGQDADRGVQAPRRVAAGSPASSPTTRSGPATTSPTRRCSSGSPSTGRSSCSRARCTSARPAS